MSQVGSLLYKIDADTAGAETNVDSLTGKLGGLGTAMASAYGTKVMFDYLVAVDSTTAKASTLYDEQTVDVENLNDEILDLSSASGISADALNEGLYQALSAGIPITGDATEMTNFLQVAIKTSVGGFTDLTTAVDVLTTVINAYGLESSDANDIANILIKTQNAGKTTVDELGASLAAVIPTAASLNVGFEQIGAALAVMTAQGIPTSQAVTQLNAILSELSKTGSKASKALDETTKSAFGTSKSFEELIEEGFTVSEILVLMDEHAQKTDTNLKSMFGSVQAGAGALALTGQNAETFNEVLAEMESDTDAVDEAFSTMSDTLEFKMDSALQLIKNSLLQVFLLIEPIISGFFKLISTFPGITKLAIGFLGVVFAFVALRKAISLAKVAGGAFKNVLKDMGKALVKFTSAIFKSTLAVLKWAFSMIKQGIKAVIMITKSIWKSVVALLAQAFAWVLANIPLLLWIAGIALAIGFVVFIIAKFDLLQKALMIIAKIFMFVAKAILFFAKLWISAFKTIWAFIAPIMKFIGIIIVGVMYVVFKIITFILKGIVDIFQWAWDLLIAGVKWAWDLIKKFIIDPLVSIAKFYWDILQWIWGIWLKIWEGIKDFTKWVWDLIKKFILQPLVDVWNTIEDILGRIAEIWDRIWNGIKDTTQAVWDGIVGIIKGSVNVVIDILNFFINSINRVMAGVTGVVNQIPFVDFDVPEIPNIPSLDIGTNKVKKDGLSVIHKGEAIIPSAEVEKGGFTNQQNNNNMIQNRNIGNVTINIMEPNASKDEIIEIVNDELGVLI